MNRMELRIERFNTYRFIQADPDVVALQPNWRAANGSGGYTLNEGLSRTPQVMRMIPLTGFTEERMTLDGKKVEPRFMLMGMWDAAVERWDRFDLDGWRYEVLHVQEKKDYQTKAEVISLGLVDG